MRSVANLILPGPDDDRQRLQHSDRLRRRQPHESRDRTGHRRQHCPPVQHRQRNDRCRILTPRSTTKRAAATTVTTPCRCRCSEASRAGLTMNAQYTFGKSEGLSSGSNEARTSAQLDNFEADRGRNNFDVRHTFNVSALYELPIGKGKTVRSSAERETSCSAAGRSAESLTRAAACRSRCWSCGPMWSFSASWRRMPERCRRNVRQWLHGQPADPLTASFPALPTGFIAVVNTPGGGNSRNIRRPNLIAGVNPYLNNDRNFINPAAFAIPAPGTFGDFAAKRAVGPDLQTGRYDPCKTVSDYESG